jgi:hypothetical protein
MLLMIYLCNLRFTYDLLMIYLWNEQGGCAYHTYENYHLLSILMDTYVYFFYLYYLCQLRITNYTYSTYDLPMIYLWNGQGVCAYILRKNTYDTYVSYVSYFTYRT